MEIKKKTKMENNDLLRLVTIKPKLVESRVLHDLSLLPRKPTEPVLWRPQPGKIIRQQRNLPLQMPSRGYYQFRQSTRNNIIASYKKELSDNEFSYCGTNLSCIMETLNSKVVTKNKGVFYASDYSKKFGSGVDWRTIQGLTNTHFWINGRNHFFKSREDVLPSDSLKAFFMGPTMADCGNVVQACCYQRILNQVGEEKFNKLFGKPLAQFIITQILYQEFESKFYRWQDESEIIRRSLDLKKVPKGNPLYFLFDKIDDISDETLQHNDIVYIRGVEDYDYKHLSGFSRGWNLICVKENPSDKLRFIGFGQDEFKDGPKTYDEMKKLLVDGYNKKQSQETKSVIKAREEEMKKHAGASILDKNIQNFKISVELAKLLENDIKDEIVGYQIAIRLNTDRLQLFIDSISQSWYDKELPKGLVLLKSIIPGELTNLSEFTLENKTSTFENYELKNEIQEKMYDLVLKLRNEICKADTEPCGLILSGVPGIGKTHLSTALARSVIECGKNVTYVDSPTLGNMYQESGGRLNDFTSFINNADLIILDDINSEFGSGGNFFKQALQYVIENKKAILITSNNNFVFIQKHLPKYFGYTDPIANNFITWNNIISESYRKSWTTENLETKSLEEKLKLLNSFDGAAGIIITESRESLESIASKFREINPIIKYKISKPPYGSNHKITPDFYYNKGLDGIELVLINVYDYEAYEQLLNLVQKAHDKGIKIIVLTNSKKEFSINIQKRISYMYNKDRVKARFKIILPNII